jgi:hypothetical protein
MTHERDFDRIARTWLEVGPNEAPDRAVAAVLTAVDTTPQIRRPWRWPFWRPITMTPRTFSLIGVLLLALALGASFLVGGRPQPSPSPSPSPSSSASLVTIPEALAGEWAGTPRTFDSMASTVVRGLLSANGEWIVSGSHMLSSRIIATQPGTDAGRLTLTTALDGGPCHIGDTGTYDYQLSPGKKFLTLVAESDGCSDRVAATQGRWVRNECRTTTAIAGGDMDCYGPLEPGTYQSREVNLRFDISKGDVAPLTYGALQFTVPEGWTHVADNATRFWMMSTDQYPEIHDGVPLDGLYVFGHPQVGSRAAGCPYEAEPGVGLTPNEIVSFLRRTPALKLTLPKAVTINRRSGLLTDIELAPGWSKPCDWSSGAAASSILYANTGLSGVESGQRERLIVLDIGHGDSVAIEIFAADKSRFDALMASAMPIVDSFVFAEPGATN